MSGIFQGDCIEKLWKRKLGTVDLVFCDPPFNINFRYDTYQDNKSTAEYLEWSMRWMLAVRETLKPTGTFWLAIGDEYAAELQLEAKKLGFYLRSWVIWYYTFGVNNKNGFSRSHTHLFHFTKHPKNFTFNADAIKVPSARQLVYKDNRAKAGGRIPDNTWILRPQQLEAEGGFPPSHDVWHIPRVCGTFKERQGFHGCQMPEAVMDRIILSCSNPGDLVLDCFAGSGSTLSAAKRLGRRYVGYELSKDYCEAIKKRLALVKAPGE